MNAPDKLIKIPMAEGVYLLRAAPAKARASRQHAATLLLSAMRREKHPRHGKSGRVYLKEVRAARQADFRGQTGHGTKRTARTEC